MKQTNNIPAGYKLSPLGIIPQEWEVKRLGEVCVNKGDYGINAAAVDYNINLPTYIRITDIDDDGNFSKKDIKSVDNENAKDFILENGDIVFARTGATVGKTYLYNKSDGFLVFAGFLIRFSPNQEKILPYYLKSITTTKIYWDWVKIMSMRSGQPGINSKEYSSFSIPLPPLPEQKKIAEILGVWDIAIEKQTTLIGKLETRKRSLMQQLLTCKGESHSPLKRLKGFSGKWGMETLGDVAEKIITKNNEECKNVVTISAQRGFVKQTDFFSKTIASEVLDNYYLINKDSFCYNKSYCNGYPMGAIKRLKDFEKAVVTTLYICFKIKDCTKINIDFFEQYCEGGLFNKPLAGIANEGGRAHGLLNVTPDDFFNLKLQIPSIEEQTAIATVLTTADHEITLAKQKLASLQQQKKGLMQVLLTGKKRVKI